MSKSNAKSFLNELFEVLLAVSDQFSEDWPRWVRPFVKVIVYLSSLLFLIFISPLIIIIRIFRTDYPDAYQKLQKELEQKWYTGSSSVALRDLRVVFDKIRSSMEKVILGGLKIEPYGRFHFYQYLQVCELLYNWEIQHENFKEAKKLCDHVLNESNHDNSKDKKPHEAWVVKKSYIIKVQEGNLAAQEYLLKYVNLENENSPIKDYLFQLRKELT